MGMRTFVAEGLDEVWPLGAEDISTGQRPISSTNTQSIDALLDEIVRSSKTTFRSPESGRTSSTNQGATLNLYIQTSAEA